MNIIIEPEYYDDENDVIYDPDPSRCYLCSGCDKLPDEEHDCTGSRHCECSECNYDD